MVVMVVVVVVVVGDGSGGEEVVVEYGAKKTTHRTDKKSVHSVSGIQSSVCVRRFLSSLCQFLFFLFFLFFSSIITDRSLSIADR